MDSRTWVSYRGVRGHHAARDTVFGCLEGGLVFCTMEDNFRHVKGTQTNRNGTCTKIPENAENSRWFRPIRQTNLKRELFGSSTRFFVFEGYSIGSIVVTTLFCIIRG